MPPDAPGQDSSGQTVAVLLGHGPPPPIREAHFDTLLGIFMCTLALVLVFNLITDLLHLAVDPGVQAL